MAHEWGHSCLALGDEYFGPFGSTTDVCGHSIMNNSGVTHTLCGDYTAQPQPGKFGAHCVDGTGTNPSICSPGDATNWSVIGANPALLLNGWDFNANWTPNSILHVNNAALKAMTAVNYH